MMFTAKLQQYRRPLLVGGPLVFFIIVILIYFLTGRYISTDDAYVQAAKAAISTNVSGQVSTIYIHENQHVKKGEHLFSLDDRPYKIAVEAAQAQLLNAQLQVQALKASYHQQFANVQEAEHTYLYQQEEFNRQQKLATSGIASQMQLNEATNRLQTAQHQFNAEKQQLASILASLNNHADIALEEHPIVQQAQAQLDHAKLNLSYTVITAPFDGIATKVEYLQAGDYIETGATVFALISEQDIWIEANFKETDITYMRPGQSVVINIDAYSNQQFTGVVTSLSPGTGSIFSLLPPENATGNWVKIVQRVPIRVSINNPDPNMMLSSGLSAVVTVDTQHRRISRIFSTEKNK
jgi:membrane fusion protein (multidrug efflux system)